jgi:Enoyl-(Acyl carrier protein) reductase
MRRGGGGSIVNIASISALWHGRKTPGGLPGYDVAKAGMIRMTTRLASLEKNDGIRANCLAPGWIAVDGPRQYWESLTPSERAERGVPSRLLTADEIAGAVERLADDISLAGRVLVWWSDDEPKLIQWGDRGCRAATLLEGDHWTGVPAIRLTSACSGHVKVSRILRSAKCAPPCRAADARR